MSLPENLLYTSEHEWVRKEGNKVRVGITDFAQDELGDIVFVELPEVDDDVSAEMSFGSVESVKTVSELNAPITGKIIEINEDLEDSPEAVNESPYEDGWMVVIEIADENELGNLLTSEQYQELLDEA